MSKFVFKAESVYVSHDPYDEDENFHHYTIFMTAIHKKICAARRLLENYITRGIDLERCNSQGQNALYVACSSLNLGVILRLMMDSGCNIQRELPCGTSPIQAFVNAVQKHSYVENILKAFGEKIGYDTLWKYIQRNRFLVNDFYSLSQHEHNRVPRHELYNWVIDGATARPASDTETIIDHKFIKKRLKENEEWKQISENIRNSLGAIVSAHVERNDGLLGRMNNADPVENERGIITVEQTTSFPVKKYVSSIPKEFVCSICLQPYNNPVTTSVGNVYCKACIQSSIDNGNLRDPLTNTPITKTLCPAGLVYRMMNEYEEK